MEKLVLEESLRPVRGLEMMKKLFLFLIVGLLLVSCSVKEKEKGHEWKGTVTEENGVTIVHNPIEPIYPGNVLTLEEEMTIGVKDGPEEYLFGKISGIVIDNGENIYVLDDKKILVSVFNKTGEFVHSFGRKGQGPGEMKSPDQIHLDSRNRIAVTDFNRGLHYYNLDGSFIHSVFSARLPIFARTAIDSKDNIVGISVNPNPENPNKASLILKKFNPNLEPLFDIYTSPELEISKNPVGFWIYRLGINSKDEVVYAIPKDYKIIICYPGGQKKMIIEKEYIPEKVPEALKQEFLLSYGPGMKPSDMPSHYPPIDNLFIDEEDRMFIITHQKTTDRSHRICDVFNSQGNYLTSIPFSNNWKGAAWKNQKLYTVYTDDEGYQYIKRYKVKWNF